MPNLFLSYRRNDSADATGRLYDRLIDMFGRDSIFKDVDSIPPGVPFPDYIREWIDKTDVFLAVIGPHWLACTDVNGRRRIDDPADSVRIEIETALVRNVLVIPVTIGNAKLPDSSELPGELLPKLAILNAVQARPDPDFHTDVTNMLLKIDPLFSSATDRIDHGGLSGRGSEHNSAGIPVDNKRAIDPLDVPVPWRKTSVISNRLRWLTISAVVVVAIAAGLRNTEIITKVFTPLGKVVSHSQRPGASEASIERVPSDQLLKDLEISISHMQDGAGYSVRFLKVERDLSDGVMRDTETIMLTVGDHDKRIRATWIDGDPGRDVLYIEGENDGDMLVKAGGFKSRLPAMHIAPRGSLAMQESNRSLLDYPPLTLATWARQLIRNSDLRRAECAIIPGDKIDGEDEIARTYVVRFTSKDTSPKYREIRVSILRKQLILAGWVAYGWPGESGQPESETLLEAYFFTHFRTLDTISDQMFDPDNLGHLKFLEKPNGD